MGKKEQIADNAIVERYIDELSAELSATCIEYVGRLRSCTAYIYKTTHFTILRSYNTVIAAIYQSTPTAAPVFIDFLRCVYGFTRTSAQHVAKFKHDYFGNCGLIYTWRDCK